MAAPTNSLTLQDLRQRISRRLDDYVSGLAAGGTAGTGATNGTMTATGDIETYPTTPGYFIGAEVSIVTGTGSVQSRKITGHSFADPTVTLTVAGTWTATDATSEYEIHRKFTKAQYDDAINAAINTLADGYFTDTDSVYWAAQKANTLTKDRHEYPVPGSLNYLYGIDYLDCSVTEKHDMGHFDAYRALGDATARTEIAQGFKVGTSAFYKYFVIPMLEVGTVTDNINLEVHTDSTGPSGTTVTYGTSDTITGSNLDEGLRNIVFQFNPAIYLSADTQYHMVLTRSGSVSSSNYYRVCEDDDNGYGDGTMYTSDGTTYTAVAGSDLIFAIFRESDRWIALKQKRSGIDGWEYRRIGSDQIYIPFLPYDMAPMRIRGLSAIAEVSTETATVPIRPEWVEAFAVDFLLSGRSGVLSPDNYSMGAKEWARQVMSRPRPTRPLPPNSVRIFA